MARRSMGLAELMSRYVAGEPGAFDELHRRLRPKVRARFSFQPRESADDLVQLTFLRAHAARRRFDETRAATPNRAVVNWYLAIARTVMLEHLRRCSRRAERQARWVANPTRGPVGSSASPVDPEAMLIEQRRRQTIHERVHRAIRSLPSNQRRVIELHRLRGLSIREVSEALGVRPGAVRVRAHRAYRALGAHIT